MCSNAVSNNHSQALFHIDAGSSSSRHLPSHLRATRWTQLHAPGRVCRVAPREVSLIQRGLHRYMSGADGGDVKVIPSGIGCETAGYVKQVRSASPSTVRWGHFERITCFMSIKSLLTIDAAARELHVSRSTLYRLIQTRALPAVKVRGCRRVSRTALDRYITSLERQSHLADVEVSYE